MSKKLWFLTKVSLNKKIKTKWFLVANIIFAIIIIGLINIDSVISFFGGDFDDDYNVYVLDESDYDMYDSFEKVVNQYQDFLGSDCNIIRVNSENEGVSFISDDNSVMVVVMNDDDNYMKAKIISNNSIDNNLYQVITSGLDNIKRELALASYGIDNDIMTKINSSILIERVKLNKDSLQEDSNNFLMGVVFPILTLPVFMLTIFLVQMIGAEINEEKSTKGMEIIISNVSSKIHFLSKLISGNCFVLLQGLLLLIYGGVAIFIRIKMTGSFDVDSLLGMGGVGSINELSGFLVSDKLFYQVPLILILIILNFIGYSLLAAITSSMTTNMEDFQQVQTPIVLISLVGYYLGMMASMFKGSLFIKIFSYVPFISTMLAPSLLMLGQVGIVDVIISIGLMGLVIYFLVKYGLRIYKVGILNYSSTNIWKRMFKAVNSKSR